MDGVPFAFAEFEPAPGIRMCQTNLVLRQGDELLAREMMVFAVVCDTFSSKLLTCMS